MSDSAPSRLPTSSLHADPGSASSWWPSPPHFGAELVLESGAYRIGKDAGNDLVEHRHLRHAPPGGAAARRRGLHRRPAPQRLPCRRDALHHAHRAAGLRSADWPDRAQGDVRGAAAPRARPVGGTWGPGGGLTVPMRELFAVLERVRPGRRRTCSSSGRPAPTRSCARALHSGGPRAAQPRRTTSPPSPPAWWIRALRPRAGRLHRRSAQHTRPRRPAAAPCSSTRLGSCRWSSSRGSCGAREREVRRVRRHRGAPVRRARRRRHPPGPRPGDAGRPLREDL